MSNREIFIDKLRQLSKEEMLERYVALLNTEKLTDYVADLEAKLAKNKKWLASNEGFLENQKLKQQLAEKEKMIENLNNRILISQLQAPKEQILNILGSQCIQYNPDQDKISFAVEQLEKVKEMLRPYLRFDINLYLQTIKNIDNQIKQLKEEKC